MTLSMKLSSLWIGEIISSRPHCVAEESRAYSWKSTTAATSRECMKDKKLDRYCQESHDHRWPNKDYQPPFASTRGSTDKECG